MIGAAGITYYPWATAKKFGADLSGGYLFKDFALTGGYDFLQNKWIMSGGYVNTRDDKTLTSPPSGGGTGNTELGPL